MQNPNISSEMRFELFKIPKKGVKPKKLPKMVENDLLVTFRSLLEVKITFYGHMDGCIVFRRSKFIGNEVSNMIISFLDFFCTFFGILNNSKLISDDIFGFYMVSSLK